MVHYAVLESYNIQKTALMSEQTICHTKKAMVYRQKPRVLRSGTYRKRICYIFLILVSYITISVVLDDNASFSMQAVHHPTSFLDKFKTDVISRNMKTEFGVSQTNVVRKMRHGKMVSNRQFGNGGSRMVRVSAWGSPTEGW